MIITAIRRGRDGMYTVQTDSGCEITIDSETFDEASDIAAGLETDECRLEELQLLSFRRQSRTRALRLIARREYCRAELLRKLKDYPDEAAESAADEMERLGFLDDERYARMFAEDEFRLKKHAWRRVAYDMAQRGVSRDLAESIARELAPDPAEALDELLGGRLGSDLETEKGCRRCIAALQRYGYENGDIAAAMRRKAYGE